MGIGISGAATLFFLAATASSPPAAPGAVDATGRWVLATDAVPPARWLEVEIDGGSRGLRARMDGYAEAAQGFDAPVFTDVAWSGLEARGDRVRAEASLRRRSLVVELRVDGDRMRGTISDGERERPVVGRRIRPLSDEALSDVVGIYDPSEPGASSLLVTWREFGGLRAIELETGAGLVLDPLAGGSFATRRSLSTEGSRAGTLTFERTGPGSGTLTRTLPDGGEREYSLRSGFSQERIAFDGDGVTLRGTLLRPPATDPVPAVILVHGSGPIYRTALADRAVRFAEWGGAAFIYDKRGTGRSEGSWRSATFQELAADALAALRRVGRLPGIDARRLGFQGHSQAGFVIPVAAADRPEVAFAAVVSGGPIGTGPQTVFDKRNDLRRAGHGPEAAERALDLLRRVHAYVRDGEGDRETLEAEYLAAQRQPWFPVLDLPRLDGLPSWDDPPPFLERAREELAFDGGAYVRRMGEIPLLVLLGGADETVPPEETAAAWRAHLGHAGSPRVRIEIVPDADHGFRHPGAARPSPRVPAYDAIHREWWNRHVAPGPP